MSEELNEGLLNDLKALENKILAQEAQTSGAGINLPANAELDACRNVLEFALAAKDPQKTIGLLVLPVMMFIQGLAKGSNNDFVYMAVANMITESIETTLAMGYKQLKGEI